MCTDFVDGMIARACGLVSETGKWLDPLADKLVCLPLFAVMAWYGRVDPEWVAVLVLADTVGTVGRPWLTASATLWGKLKTCLAFGLVVWCMILPHANQ
jgi:phosphatidylglycerophosphate synthase